MSVSRLDRYYRKLVSMKFFTKGWGKTEDLARLVKFRRLLVNKTTGQSLVKHNHPIKIVKENVYSDCRILEGSFQNPMAIHCPDVTPSVVDTAFFQMILPLKWRDDGFKPMCIHLAGTGDHFYWRRRNFIAKPLLREGIGSIILENPYYGLRKPKDQTRSCLRYVTDVFVMGGSLILECTALLNYCEQEGYGPLGVTGMSLGGHMASLAASYWQKPLVLVPCLSWSTASVVFTEGILSDSVDWKCLQHDYMKKREGFYQITTLIDELTKHSDKKIATPKKEVHEAPTSYDIDLVKMSRHDPNAVVTFNEINILNQSVTLKENIITDSLTSIATRRKNAKRHKDSVKFMNKIMDEFTHLQNYPVPYDPSLITVFCAESDAYVPRCNVYGLQDVWPGSTIVYLRSGHIGAYLWYRKTIISEIASAFRKAKYRYPDMNDKTFVRYKLKDVRSTE